MMSIGMVVYNDSLEDTNSGLDCWTDLLHWCFLVLN